MPVEDHVFGTFDLAEADDIHVAKLVVERPGRLAVRTDMRRRGQLVVSGADIDLADDPVLVLEPADVDCGRQQQSECQDHAVDAAHVAEVGQPIDDHEHDQCSDQRLHHRALTPSQADTAQHGRGEHRDLQAHPDVPARGS
ncbi:hypothetical protein D9M68_739650 [compost metagenome]